MLSLRESLPETGQQFIDEILHMIREMRVHQSQILQCHKCLSNRSSLLLLAAVTERIVQMLDHVFEKKSQENTQNGFAPSCHITLHVGCVKLSDQTRDYFLKGLLALRLKKLDAAIHELREAIGNRPTDSMFLARGLMLNYSLQRVEYMQRQIPLWRS